MQKSRVGDANVGDKTVGGYGVLIRITTRTGGHNMHPTICAALLALASAPVIAAEPPAPFGLAIGGPCEQAESMNTEI